MRQSSVVSTRLTRNEPSKTTGEMTQSPKKAMKKLTSVSDQGIEADKQAKGENESQPYQQQHPKQREQTPRKQQNEE